MPFWHRFRRRWFLLVICCFQMLAVGHGFPNFDFKSLFSSSSQIDSATCNDNNSSFSCPCRTCWHSFQPFQKLDIEWVAVEFQKCLQMSKELDFRLREKVAEWFNQECAVVLNCRQFTFESFSANNVIIGGVSCDEDAAATRGTVYLNVLTNSSASELDEAVLVPSGIIGSVIQAREHLLSSLVDADLDSVTTIVKTPSLDAVRVQNSDHQGQNPIYTLLADKNLKLAAVFLAAVVASFTLTLMAAFICAMCMLSVVKWKRFSTSKWVQGSSKLNKKQKNMELATLHDTSSSS